MIVKLIRVFKCDYQYCSAIARIQTSSMECGTDTRKEEAGLEKRGWAVWGFKHYCRIHKGDVK